jgi:membrane protease YdiL (CAAX protease family)
VCRFRSWFRSFHRRSFHLGNPVSMPKTVEEISSAVIMGFIWGVMTWRTRSILFPLVKHYGTGVTFDGFITFGSVNK